MLTTATYEGTLVATITYEASSLGEIAIMGRMESLGLGLLHKDGKEMRLQSVDTGKVAVFVEVLEVFRLTCGGERMGIVVRFMAGETRKGLNFLGGGAEEEESNTGDFGSIGRGRIPS